MSTTRPTTRGRSFAVASLGTLLHAVLVLVLFLLWIVYVPAAKKTFDEFGMTLPQPTLEVIRLSNWVAEYWWMLTPGAFLLGLADLALLWLLSGRSWRASLLGALVLSLLPVSLIGVTTVAVELPKAKLREGLAR